MIQNYIQIYGSCYIHPPEDGNVSDAESGDEENPGVEHLFRTLLQTEAEVVLQGNVEEEQHEISASNEEKEANNMVT